MQKKTFKHIEIHTTKHRKHFVLIEKHNNNKTNKKEWTQRQKEHIQPHRNKKATRQQIKQRNKKLE